MLTQSQSSSAKKKAGGLVADVTSGLIFLKKKHDKRHSTEEDIQMANKHTKR